MEALRQVAFRYETKRYHSMDAHAFLTDFVEHPHVQQQLQVRSCQRLGWIMLRASTCCPSMCFCAHLRPALHLAGDSVDAGTRTTASTAHLYRSR